MTIEEYSYFLKCIYGNVTPKDRREFILWDYERLKNKNMKTITLENGQKVEISEESYNALAKAAHKEVTWDEIYHEYFDKKERGFTEELHDSVDIKIHTIKKLIITAKYLNGAWTPDWNDNSKKYYISIKKDSFSIDYAYDYNSEPCHFKSEELAWRAIDILGEEVIKTALGNY